LLQMEGFRPRSSAEANPGLSIMASAFPNAQFPLGKIHEFICENRDAVAATSGFLSGLVSTLMVKPGFVLWLSLGQSLYPPGLLQYDIDPSRIIFIDCRKDKELLWVLEEILKSEGIIAAVAIIPRISFTESRRLQLAVEKTKVTGFVICTKLRSLSATAAVARWKIEAIPSYMPDQMPGLGFPGWKARLLKVRNGKPADFTLYWVSGGFRKYESEEVLLEMEDANKRKTG